MSVSGCLLLILWRSVPGRGRVLPVRLPEMVVPGYILLFSSWSGPLYDLVQFSAIQPDATAGRAIIYLNSLPFGQQQVYVVTYGTLHLGLLLVHTGTLSSETYPCHSFELGYSLFHGGMSGKKAHQSATGQRIDYEHMG